MKNQHTPGPWTANFDGHGGIEISNKERQIGYVSGGPEQQANARLIAAAPEMAHFILEMADRYPNSEWISGEAKRILTKAGIQP